MKYLSFIVLFSLVCVAMSAHLEKDESDLSKRNIDEVGGGAKKRHRRWQSSYGYDYTPPQNPYVPYERQSFSSRNSDPYQQIQRLLEDIASSIRIMNRQTPPPPPPPPVYVPYPVPVYQPPCQCPTNTKIESRFPVMEDSRQNWGSSKETGITDNTDETLRPVSFEAIKPDRPLNRQPPKVDHGTSQAGSSNAQGREPSFIADSTSAPPTACESASLACCRTQSLQRTACFNNLGCQSYTEDLCRPETLAEILTIYRNMYAPRSP